MPWPSEPVLLEGVTAAQYHRDEGFGDVPTLSRSIAHTGITASWKHAAAEHPRLAGTVQRKQSDEMDLGSLVHALLLGGEEQIEIHGVPNWIGKTRSGLKKETRKAGRVPVKLGDYQKAVAACEILKPEICRAIEMVVPRSGADDRPGIMWEDFGREITVLWEEGEPEICSCGHREDRHGVDLDGRPYCLELCSCQAHDGAPPVRCRARFDLYYPPAALLADLKVVTSGYASASKFIRGLNSEEDSGAMQAASYLRGLESVHPELAGRTTFVFLRVEPYPPYSVVPIVVTQGMRRLGEDRWTRGVQGWAECMASGVWPGPAPAYAQVETWAVQRELDRMAEQEGTEDAVG